MKASDYTVKDMVIEWLKKHKFTGLYNSDCECCCPVDDLAPFCDGCMDCQPGHCRMGWINGEWVNGCFKAKEPTEDELKAKREYGVLNFVIPDRREVAERVIEKCPECGGGFHDFRVCEKCNRIFAVGDPSNPFNFVTPDRRELAEELTEALDICNLIHCGEVEQVKTVLTNALGMIKPTNREFAERVAEALSKRIEDNCNCLETCTCFVVANWLASEGTTIILGALEGK